MKAKTTTASFRVDKAALDALKEDSKKQNVSVNTLVNQLLLTYFDYDRPMKRFQVIKLSTPTFRSVLRAADDAMLAQAGDSAGSEVPRTYILAKSGKVTIESCLDYLKTLSVYGKLFEYSDAANDGNLSFTLSHNFGSKGTVFLQHYVHALFAPLGKGLKFTPDENSVTFELI
jgi:hypothetical protein